MSLLPVRAVIFDMDGVLLDTEPLYTRVIAEVAARFGKTYDWTLKRQVMGRGPVEGARLLIAALELPLSAEELFALQDPLLERAFENVPPLPGAPELVRELAARGTRLAIATSSRARMFARKSAPHAWFSLFESVVCGDDPGVLAWKPAPDIYLAAAERLGVPPEECLVVEDAPAGVLAGKRAGMRVFALPDPELGDELVADADRVVHDYAELREAVLAALG